MEVEIYWSSSSCFYSDTGKRMQQVVSEPSILGGERRLESRQSDAGITENRWEAHWRRMDARLDELKKAILDLSFSTLGRSVETTDASSGSRESPVRAEAEHRSCSTDLDPTDWAKAEHRSCSTDLDPTDCNLTPMRKTEEHKVRGIDSESYFLSFSHDSMNSFVGSSIGVSELSTRGDDSLIEQPSNIVEEESTMSLKDAIAIYVEEFVNSRNSSMKFEVAARASFDVKAEGLVDEEEKEVSKEVSMGEFLCMCKGIDGKYVHMDRTFDAFLLLDSMKVPVRELAATLNAVRNLTRLRVRYPKPLVKMKFMVVPVDSCRVFKGGGMTRVTHMQIQYDEVIGGNLGKQIDLGVGSAAMWQLEIFQYRDENLNKTIVHFYVHFGQRFGRLFTGGVDGQFGTPQVQDMPICFDVGRLSMVKGGLITDVGAVVFGFVDDRKEQGLSLEFICPTYRNCDERSADLKFCISWKKAVSDEISAGVLMVCQGIDGKYVEMDAKATTLELLEVYIVEEDINDVVYLLKKLKLFSGINLNYIDLDGNEGEEEKVLAENGTVNGEHVDKNLNLFGNAVPNDIEGFNLGGVEGFNTWDNDLKFDLHYVPSLLNISLQALDVCAGGIVSLKQVPENIHQTIGRCETEKLQAGVHYAMGKPISYVHSDITASVSLLEVRKEAKPQPLIVWSSSSPVCGLITKVTFSEVDKIDQPASLYVATKKADEEIAHTYNHNLGLSLSRLRFTVYGLWERTDMAYFFFTRDIMTWKSSFFEPGNDGTVARDYTYIDDIMKGCLAALDTSEKSTGRGGKKTTHQLSDIGWLVSIWFPKPKVKMKLSKMRHKKLGSMIPCGQGILRGMDCYDHKLKKGEETLN